MKEHVAPAPSAAAVHVIAGRALIRVVLIDDHTSVRQALAYVFEREADCEVIAQAGSLAEIGAGARDFDVAVVDLDLPGGEGLEAVRELHDTNARGTVLALTASTDRKEIALAVEAGADGVLHKSVKVSEIIGAMRCLSAGEQLFSAREVTELLRLASRLRDENREARRALDRLTPREREVLQTLAEGLTDKEIAERLSITVETVHTHMTGILGKLGVESRLRALVFAVRYGAITIG